MLLLLLQIEGGFVQGMGWLCLEEMIWGDKVGIGFWGMVDGFEYVLCVPLSEGVGMQND
jgi:hypothetical protein